jgi:hypothetical protein
MTIVQFVAYLYRPLLSDDIVHGSPDCTGVLYLLRLDWFNWGHDDQQRQESRTAFTQ